MIPEILIIEFDSANIFWALTTCFLCIFYKCTLIQVLFSTWHLLACMGLIAQSYLGGSCFCVLAYILVIIMHPLAVFLLLQQELHSVVQFLNDLISSIFSIFSLEFSVYSWTPSPLLFSSLSFTQHSANEFTFHSCHSMDCCPGIWRLPCLNYWGKTISSCSFLATLCWLWVSSSYLSCVFVFHRSRDHKAERSPRDHIILWMFRLWPESQVTYSKNYSQLVAEPGPEPISPNQEVLASLK